MVGQLLQARRTGRGLDHPVAELGQDFHRVVADVLVVLHHQNRLRPRALRLLLRPLGRLGILHRGQQARQVDLHGRALAGLAVDLHVPARLLDEAVDLREAEARAVAHILGREEGLERLGQHLAAHPGAGVADAQHDILARRDFGLPGRVAFVEEGIGRLDGQPAAAGHGVASIDREVEDGAFQLVRVGVRPPQAAGEDGLDLYRLAQGTP